MSNSEEDSQLRKEWRTTSRVQIYSSSRRKWFVGEVSQIFHDSEGEWLEIRYDKSMSKQVQRFSTDVKPTEEQVEEFKKQQTQQKIKKDTVAPVENSDPVEATRDVRASWNKGDKVEVYSNTHQAWYAGEIVDLLKDEEGEWLNILWHRENNEPMSKQVQRFSTDVRPIQNKTEQECIDNKANTKSLEEEIKQRRQGYKRRAPPFARTSKGVLWQYPATQTFRRRTKKLENIDEIEDEEETESGVEKWKIEQVCAWLKNMGSAYEKYVPKFRNIRGSHLKRMNEDDFKSMGLPKLHAVKLSFEIFKLLDKTITKDVDVDVLRWTCADVLKWAQKNPILSQYASKFESHGIDGIMLFELNVEDLFVIGIRQSHREKIVEIIQQFAKELFPGLTSTTTNVTDDKNKQLIEDTVNQNNKDLVVDKDKKETDVLSLSTNKFNDPNNSKRRRQSMQIADIPPDIQVLKDIADLLVVISKELNVEKIQNQANLIQKKAYSLTNDMTNNWSQESANADEQSLKGPSSSHENNQSSGKFSEADGKSATGISLPYVNSLEQKKGHRRRQSKPFLDQNATEENKKDAGSIEN